MGEKKQSWFERLIGIFNLETVHHRTCWLCHKRILKAHKYRHVKAGLFWADQVEHRNCSNPTLGKPYHPEKNLTPELPFDAPGLEGEPINRTPFYPPVHDRTPWHLPAQADEPFVDGNIFPSYEDVPQEKTNERTALVADRMDEASDCGHASLPVPSRPS
jgi:hypothetical protein